MRHGAGGARRSARGVLAFIVAAMLAACGSTAVHESYYTLSSAPAANAPQSASPSIFVGPISVPEAVDRNEMVLRTGANQVEISEQYLWAEPLKAAIPRVIGDTLSRELGTSRVLTSRSAAALPVDYRVAIEIQRFDSSLDEGASVDALWTITRVDGGTRRSGRTRVTEPVASRDPAALAAAHSRALDRVGRDIAAALKSGA